MEIKNIEHEQFGQLRAILHQGPSAQTWLQLERLSLSWPDSPYVRQVAIPYAEDMLGRWPRSLHEQRRWPSQWLAMLANRQAVPWASLARSFKFDPVQMSRFAGTGVAMLLPYAHSLTHLDLNHMSPLDQDLSALLMLSSPQLEHLTLNRLNMPPRELTKLLSQAEHIGPHLKHLSLSRVNLRDEHLKAILEGPLCAQLEQLDLSRCEGLSPAGISALFGRAWPELERLDLELTELTDQVLSALVEGAALGHLPKLRTLSLGQSVIWRGLMVSRPMMTSLWRAQGLERLESLKLGPLSLSAEELVLFSEPCGLTGLTTLELMCELFSSPEQLQRLYAQLPKTHPKHEVVMAALTQLERELDRFTPDDELAILAQLGGAMLPRASSAPAAPSATLAELGDDEHEP